MVHLMPNITTRLYDARQVHMSVLSRLRDKSLLKKQCYLHRP